MTYSARLHRVIPSGCHTYSRGDSQFPSNAPQILQRGEGAYVYDADGRKFLDYGMGLRAVGIGYAEKAINSAVENAIAHGNCLSRPSLLELQAAELACEILGFDMVKFCKNGSTATTAAIKLARAATGRKIVACAKQPFFSYDDWFIETTSRDAGCFWHCTQVFDSFEKLENIVRYHKIAAVILEPKDYDLVAIRNLCYRNNIVLIFDETITGFRYDGWSKGGTLPDLACFGKAMANGFSVACVAGDRELMEDVGAREDFFFVSTTHGAEMAGLAAFMATVKFYQKHEISRYLKAALGKLESMMPNPMPEKTLFMQEMVKNGVLMPYLSPCYRHGEKELEITRIAIEKSMESIANGAILEGPRCQPVF